jgi:hypothetical protein
MENTNTAVDASIEILGFNPKSNEETIFKVNMTPEVARYILDHHNKSNRKFVPAQKNAIATSIANEGWLHTGDTCAFDRSGNLTEYQHRLENIAEGNEARVVWVSTGVKKDTFENAAPAKNRTKFDVVWRYEKDATKDEVTTLEQVLIRRKGKDAQAIGGVTLNMKNALKLFREWKDYVRVGMNITSKFFDDKKVEKFNPWQRTFNSWATLMVKEGMGDVAKDFLKLLKKHHSTKDECRLFTGMEDYFLSKPVGYLTGTKKTEQMHYMLCRATDRFLVAPKGDCGFGLKFVDANHSNMFTKSPTYRSFLGNSQGLVEVKKLKAA